MSSRGPKIITPTQHHNLEEVTVDCSSDTETPVDVVVEHVSKTEPDSDAPASSNSAMSTSDFPLAIPDSMTVSLGRNAAVPLASSTSSRGWEIARNSMNMAAGNASDSSQPSQYTPVINNYHYHQHDNRHYQIHQVQNIENDTAQLKARIKSLEKSGTDLQTTLDLQKSTIEEWNTWRKKILASYATLKESNIEVEQKLQKLEDKARQRSGEHEAEISSQKRRYNDLRNKYTTLQKELRDQKTAAKTERDALRADIATKDASIAKLKEEALELGKWKNSYSDLWAMKEGLAKEKEKADRECEPLRAQVAALEATLASRQSVLDQANKDIGTWEEKCKKLDADLLKTRQSWLQSRTLGDGKQYGTAP